MKKTLLGVIALAAIFGTFLMSSCNESTGIGGELLEQDQLSVAYLDTFNIQTSTVREDSLLVPASDLVEATHPIGILEDPIFGTSEASVYMEFAKGRNISPKDLANISIDSVIMSLQYDSLSYGDISTPRSVEVYALTEPITATISNILKNNVYTKQSYKTEAMPLGSKIFTPKIKQKVKTDSVPVSTYIYLETKKKDSTYIIKTSPHLRIPLDLAFAKKILKLDSLSLNNNDEFRKKIPGFFIKPTSKNGGMVNFRLTAAGTANVYTKISIYYRDANDRRNSYDMFGDVNSVKVSNYKNTFSPNILAAINKPSTGDSILFLQGLAGTNVKVTLPSLKNLKNKGLIINKAELEFYTLPIVSGNVFTPAPQLVAVDASNGKGAPIVDVLYSLSSNYAAFGGKPVEVTINGVKLNKYTFNISNIAQGLIDDKANVSNSFYLTTAIKSEKSYRTILNGAKHSKYRPKLKLYYTKVG
jgi:hypothetical protein